MFARVVRGQCCLGATSFDSETKKLMVGLSPCYCPRGWRSIVSSVCRRPSAWLPRKWASGRREHFVTSRVRSHQSPHELEALVLVVVRLSMTSTVRAQSFGGSTPHEQGIRKRRGLDQGLDLEKNTSIGSLDSHRNPADRHRRKVQLPRFP